jgi:hypothetical protein
MNGETSHAMDGGAPACQAFNTPTPAANEMALTMRTTLGPRLRGDDNRGNDKR